MIAVNNVSLSFGSFELFKDLNFVINPRDRIGLVGKNGAGKTTLLKVILNEIHPNTGDIVYPKNISFGYLPQEITFNDTCSVYEETVQAFEQVIQLEKQIAQFNKELSERDDYHSESYLQLASKLSEASEHYDILGGDKIESDIQQTLLGLGFEESDLVRPTSEFSGGWRMRIELAKILLRRPDVFLLDEPTNHLDIESIQWLEAFLKNYEGAVVLISHDRTFLDTITNRTIEISLGQIHDYKASYTEYVELRKQRREQQLAAYKNQQKKIEDTERFIERFRYKATKAVQVQSRIKQLEKMDKIEVEDEEKAEMLIKFPPAPRAGAISLELKNIAKRYGELTVFNDVDMIIERGERVAFVGKNGAGKSTLVKIINGQIDFEGKIKYGHNLNIGYFAQNEADTLNKNKTVYDILDEVAVGDIRQKLRDILGAFLFHGDDVDKKVMVLSGGERTRLALARLLLKPYSLLVLDEPTNHLDMRSKDLLKEALLQYSGTLIIVSHDRHFLNGLANKVYEFGNKKVKEHLGGIDDFLYRKKMASLRDIEQKEQKNTKQNNTELSDNKAIYLARKEHDKKIRKVENRIKKFEQQIMEAEERINEIEAVFKNPDKQAEIDDELYHEYDRKKAEVEQKMKEWDNLLEDLEDLKKQRN